MKITAKYIKKMYEKGVYALKDVSLDIESGDFVVIVGESGCGKSTLLKVVAGLEKPTAGELYLDGLLANNIAAKDRNIAMVFQEYVLYPRFTVWENLSVALEKYGLDRAEEEQRISQTLEALDLTNVAAQLPRNLSGGQQQRVALAKAMVTKPKAILFDEPLSNVADKQKSEYIDYIKKLKQTLPDATFLYVTHNLDEVMQLGNKLAVMKNGVVLQCDDKNFVLRNPNCKNILDALLPSPPEQDERGVLNPFVNEWQQFDKNGLIAKQRKNVYINGTFDGKKLHFCNLSVNVDENFVYRFVGKTGKIALRIATQKMRFMQIFGDICLSAERVDEHTLRLPDGSTVYLHELSAFCGKLCFSLDDVTVVDENGAEAFAHYRVYVNKTDGRITGNKLCLPCGKILLGNKSASGKATVTFGKHVKASLVKSGICLKVEHCLDEEVLGNEKLFYCKLKGFDNYVALWFDVKTPYLADKCKVAVDVSTISIGAAK